MILFSPAKINLFLQVRGKRADGLHELESLMQAIDLGDELHFELAKVDSLTVSGADLSNDRGNLIWRAIDLFRQETGCKDPVCIHLEKRIPMEAGLGGGSSNAATALFALNELCGRPARLEALQQMGARVGSDVPFFFSSGTALCTGSGTDVLSLDPLPKRLLYLFKPDLSLSTKAVYSVFERVGELLNAKELVGQFARGALPLRNDLEGAAFSLAPQLRELYADLARLGPVVLAGSGSTLVSFASLIDRGVRAHFLNRVVDGWY